MRTALTANPAERLHGELKTLFNGCIKERESKFKHSPRWEYLKSELLKAAKKGSKRIIVKNTDKDFGTAKAKDYAEWEIELFIDEYKLIYCFDTDREDHWKIYWM
jgi:hypothetical protein